MEIHVTLERVTIRLTGEMNMADVFTRIALAVAALQAGDTASLQAHVRDIDSHLKNVDDEVLGLQGDDTSSKTRLDAIEQGLNKIADAADPTGAAGASSDSGTPANPGGGSDTGAVSGTGSDAGNPGGASDPGAQTGTGSDAGNPGGSADTGATSGTGSAPSDGSQSADVTPGSDSPHASAPIPSSGVGSETTGQIDTPTTQS